MTKVLVFESDAAFAGELRTELSRLGCSVQVVDDGNVGLSAASAEPPQLILLSIELPRMNGFSVCNKLKKDPQLKDVPLIIMSSESSDDTFEQHKKLRTRAEDYVHKPIALGELLQHIRRLVPIGGGEEEGEDAILIDDAIEIDEEDVLEEAKPAAPAAPPPKPPTMAPPPRAPSVAPAAARAPSVAPAAAATSMPIKGDEEIEDFLGDAFGRLMGDEESAPAPAVAPGGSNGAATVSPAAPAVAPPAPKAASVPPPHKVASVPPPAPVPAEASEGHARELEQLRGELGRAKDEIVKLSKEVAAAGASLRHAESQAAMATDETDLLKREVEELKTRLASAGSAKSGVSSKEFLDLREALNKKDKELLGLRHDISKKDKELIDLRDQALSFEREKADQVDKILELERAKADLEGTVDTLRADKDLATKRAEDYKARGDKTQAALSQRDGELAQAKKEAADASLEAEAAMADLRRRSEEALQRANAEHAAAIEKAKSEHKQAIESLEGEHRSAIESLRAENDASLGKLRAQHALEIDKLRGEYEAAEKAQADKHAAELDDAAKKHAAESSAQADKHAAESSAQAEKHAAELADTRRAAEQRLAERERELIGQHEAKLASTVEEHDKAMTEREAAFLARKKELDGEISSLTVDLEQTKEKLENAESKIADHEKTIVALRSDLEATQKKLADADTHARELDATLAIRTAERDEASQERDSLKAELERRNKELSETRDKLEDAEEKGRELGAKLAAQGDELAKSRDEGEALGRDLAATRARLEKARTKWGEDKASLDRAKQALALAMERISEPDSRALDD
jgi:CheY-like chemotaxis protein